jgi:hypothetical protein
VVYFATLSEFSLQVYRESNRRMIDEQGIRKGTEGSGRGLIKTISLHCSGGTEENHGTS